MADVTPTPSPLGLLGLLGASLALGIVARLGEYKPPPWDVVKRMEKEKDETSKPPQPKVIAQREICPYVVESPAEGSSR